MRGTVPTTAPGPGTRYRNQGNRPLLDLLPAYPGRLLDCGCGPGDNARLLTARGWAVTGITIDRAEQQAAAQYCQRVYLADLEPGLPAAIGGRFDAVLTSHVLEHLVHPEQLLRDVKEALKPTGVLAVALPNVVAYTNRLRLLLGRFDYTTTGVMDEGHVRFYTFVTGAQLLQRNGFYVRVARADGAFPLSRLRHYLPPRLVAAVNQQACRRWPGLFGYQSLYVATVR